MRTLGVVCLCGLVWENAPAQDSLMTWEDLVQSAVHNESSDEEQLRMVEDLVDLHDHPIDLNRATAEELQRIPGVTPLLAYRITAFRKEQPFTSLSELLLLEGFTEEMIQGFSSFVKIGENGGQRSKAGWQVRSRVQNDLQPRRGIREKIYGGSSLKLYERVSGRVQFDPAIRLDGNLLFEKDPGETAADGFKSGFVSCGYRTIWGVVAGDFEVESGNPLTLGRRNVRNVSSVFGIAPRRSPEITGYTSSDENRYFRGLAGWFVLKGFFVSAFYSGREIHGTKHEDGSLTGFSTSDLFRTPSELAKRHASRESVYGIIGSAELVYGLRLGISAFDARYLHALHIARGETTRSFRAVGCDLGWSSDRLSILVAAAKEGTGARAAFGTVMLEPARGFVVKLLSEHFAKGYGMPFSSKRTPVPENLYSAGIRHRFSVGIGVEASWSVRRFSEGRDGLGFAESEQDKLFQIEWKAARGMNVQGRFKRSVIPRSFHSADAFGRDIVRAGAFRRDAFGLGLTVGRGGSFVWSARVDAVRTDSDVREKGLLVSHQIRFQVERNLFLDAKATLFGTESYDSRLYTFEPAVPGTLSNAAVFGRGSREALRVQWRPSSVLEITAAYSVETKDGENILGSGMDQIDGDTLERVSIQVDLTW